uniref:Uncharacterized protein n=1 Tax=Timema cristinae TaxID=61476 RepID=A0A7R9HCE7_TIMCR|nr:unnamed protein product [Timema cristinae]
MSSLNLTEKR